MSRSPFTDIRPISHRRLPKDTSWQALGSEALLDAPAFVCVIISRRCPPEEVRAKTESVLEAVRHGAVAVGGFISAGEQEAARRISAVPGAKIIRLVPYPLPFYRPSRTGLNRIADGSTLLLSGFAKGEDGCRTRERCLMSNAWATALAATAPAEGLPAATAPAEDVQEKALPDEDVPAAPAPYAPSGDPGAVFL